MWGVSELQPANKKAETISGPGSVLAGCPDKIENLSFEFQVSSFEPSCKECSF